MPSPFIQFFKTPRAQYVFDVNKNEILPVSKDAFDYLRQCVANKEDASEASLPEVKALYEKGYLRSESVVQEIQHSCTPNLRYFLDRKVEKITLQLTQNCNLRCKYCIYSETINTFQRSHSNKRMSWETAKRSIDFLWEHSVDSAKVNVGLYGGEPLLEFPLMQQIITYAKKKFDGKEISFSITTNGTLLNDEIIEFLAREDVMLLISLDGPKEIHDKNRRFANGQGSFDTVVKNVKRLAEIAPDYAEKMQFSMVIDPSNDFDSINEITFSADALVSHDFSASIVERDSDEEIVSYSEDFLWKSTYQHFLALLTLFGRYPEDKLSVISKGLIASVIGDFKEGFTSGALAPIDAPSGPCIPGKLRSFVNVDGQLFPCERVSECSKAMCLGSLDSGFNVERAEKLLNIGAITKDDCKKCWAFRHCSLCAKRADDGSELLSAKKKLSHCGSVKADTYEKLRRLIFLNEADRFYSAQVRSVKE